MRLLLSLCAIMVVLCVSTIPTTSMALSDYGSKCDNNKDCVDCKQEKKCLKCMHGCWNRYGEADTTLDDANISRRQRCIKKQAKWCNAQCWDPDSGQDEPDYVSSKPQCEPI